MRTKTLALLIFAASGIHSAQDVVSFERTFIAGNKDEYNVGFQVTTTIGLVDFKMVLTQTAKKVYEDGSVDIESQATNLHVKVNDKEMQVPDRPQPVSTVRYSKYGIPLETGSASSGPINTNFLRLVGVVPEKGMKSGESISIDFKDPKNEKNTIKGTVTLESVKDGVAVLVSKFDVTNENTATPIKYVMNRQVDTKTKATIKVNGTVSNLPTQNGVQISAVQFAMERKS
jgi:hypothetical protein